MALGDADVVRSIPEPDEELGALDAGPPEIGPLEPATLEAAVLQAGVLGALVDAPSGSEVQATSRTPAMTNSAHFTRGISVDP